MENATHSETVERQAPLAVEDQVERLSEALAQFAGAENVVEIELVRVVGTGRGPGGSEEFLEIYEWDPVDGRGLGQVIRDVLVHLRDAHSGGRFRLQVRDNVSGRLRMNQAANVVRKLVAAPVPVVAPPEKNELTQVLGQLTTMQERSDQRFEKMLERMADNKSPPATEDQMLDRMTKYKTLFGGNSGSSSIKELLETKELLDKLAGGKEEAGGWAREVIPEGFALIREMMQRDTDEPEPPADQGEDVLRAKLKTFGGQLVKAANAKMPAPVAAGAALKLVAKPAALVRMCQSEDLASVLCQEVPDLLKHVAWLERVRVEILKQGAPKPALPKGEANSAHVAGANPGRNTGSGADAQAHAAVGRGKQAAAAAETRRRPAAEKPAAVRRAGKKELPGAGRKAAPVRKGQGAVPPRHKGR